MEAPSTCSAMKATVQPDKELNTFLLHTSDANIPVCFSKQIINVVYQ